MVKELTWISRDKRLLSCCLNGIVFVHNVDTDWSKEAEHYPPTKQNIKYLACAYDPEFDFMV